MSTSVSCGGYASQGSVDSRWERLRGVMGIFTIITQIPAHNQLFCEVPGLFSSQFDVDVGAASAATDDMVATEVAPTGGGPMARQRLLCINAPKTE